MKKLFQIFIMCFATFALPEKQILNAQVLLNPATQPKFVNALPVPSVIDTRAGGTFTFTISQFTQNLGLVDPVSGAPLLTKVWGYNGSYPRAYCTCQIKRSCPFLLDE